MAAGAPTTYESSVFAWRRSDRPAQRDRGPDCLVLLLISFLFVELNALTLSEFASWTMQATDALRILHRLDLRDPHRPFKAEWWAELVGNHVAEQFPCYPGGAQQVHADLKRLVKTGISTVL
jgi:hypothetical protein